MKDLKCISVQGVANSLQEDILGVSFIKLAFVSSWTEFLTNATQAVEFIRDHYFIWRLSVAISCQLLYVEM